MAFIPAFFEPQSYWPRDTPRPPSANQVARGVRRELPLGVTPRSRRTRGG